MNNQAVSPGGKALRRLKRDPFAVVSFVITFLYLFLAAAVGTGLAGPDTANHIGSAAIDSNYSGDWVCAAAAGVWEYGGGLFYQDDAF